MVMLLRWCVVVAVVAVSRAALDDDYKEDVLGVGPRSERSPLPAPREFLLSSRYGRSGSPHVSPRNDKFFMGSRYGKRDSPDGAPLTACGALFAPRICTLLALFQGNNIRSGLESPRLSSAL